jgi:hypothetical protein
VWTEEGGYGYDFSLGPFTAPILKGGRFDIRLPGPWPYVATVTRVTPFGLVQFVDLTEQPTLNLEFTSQIEIRAPASWLDRALELEGQLSLTGPDGIEVLWPPNVSSRFSLSGVFLPYDLTGLGLGMRVSLTATEASGASLEGCLRIEKAASLEAITLEPR